MKLNLNETELKHILNNRDCSCMFCNFVRRLAKADSVEEKKEDNKQRPEKKKDKRQKWTPEIEQRAITLRNQGMSFQKIAVILGFSKPTVWNKLSSKKQEIIE